MARFCRFVFIVFPVISSFLRVAAATQLFQSAVDFATDLNPEQVATGDFNGDGFPDLAVANQGLGTTNLGSVSILLGNGKGSFQPAMKLTNGLKNPVSVAVGDFNQDGKLDLAVVNIGVQGQQISILLGNGDGAFQNPTTTSAGGGTNFVTVADLNQDGHLDLVATVSGQKLDGLSVLFGNGDGTFQKAIVYRYHFAGRAVPGIPDIISLGDGASFIAVGDFNHDGKPDVAESNLSGHIAIFLNSGNGMLNAPVDYATGSNPQSFVTADFNGDGNLDLAAACYGQTGGLQGQIDILLGNGDGTFTTGQKTLNKSNPTGIAALDFDGDGKLDIVFSGNSNNTVTLLIGNGDGTFRTSVTYDVGTGPQTVVAGDFNGDGQLDLVVSDGAGGAVTLLLAKGKNFAAARDYPTGNKPFPAVAIADFNGDHILDIAVAANNPQSVSILFGNGNGTFRSPVTYFNIPEPAAIVAADLNNDGFPDLVTVDPGGDVTVELNKGDGTFNNPVSYPIGGSFITVAVGDFNGDGNLDLVTSDNTAPFVYVLLGEGHGGLMQAMQLLVTGDAESVAVADFNGDGNLDIAAYSVSNSNVSLLFGNGNGTFGKAVNLPVPSPGTYVLNADFNLDGKVDLALLYGSQGGLTSNLVVLLGNGDGTFQKAKTTSVPGGVGFTMGIADLNSDGKPDVAIPINQHVYVLEGKGDGTFQSPLLFDAGGTGGIAVGDLNGDGKPDLATNSFTGASVLLHN